MTVQELGQWEMQDKAQLSILESKNKWFLQMEVLGKVRGKIIVALGGGSGGYSTGSKQVIELLRQKGRPYVFSNSIAPMMVGAAREALSLAQDQYHLKRLRQNVKSLKERLKSEGVELKGEEECPILIMPLPSAQLTRRCYGQFFQRGVWVLTDAERKMLRMNVLASHTDSHLSQISQAAAQIMPGLL